MGSASPVSRRTLIPPPDCGESSLLRVGVTPDMDIPCSDKDIRRR